MSTTRKDMPRKETIARELSTNNTADNPVVQHLRRQTGNALLLYLNYKHYHWQTYGPLFRDLHKLFDQLAEETLESVDPLAERVRMIGQDPPASPNEIADTASAAGVIVNLETGLGDGGTAVGDDLVGGEQLEMRTIHVASPA